MTGFLQAPFNPKDWGVVLPVSIIAISFLVFIGVWAAGKLGLVRKNNGGTQHKTFADEEDRYWRRIREVVTEPLSEVLKETNQILKELREKAIIEETLKKAERERGT